MTSEDILAFLDDVEFWQAYIEWARNHMEEVNEMTQEHISKFKPNMTRAEVFSVVGLTGFGRAYDVDLQELVNLFSSVISRMSNMRSQVFYAQQ